MRERTAATDELTYLHGDHLGSASLATTAQGGVVSEMRYYPYGETRSGTLPTDYQFTGQRWEDGLGLYDYNVRYYDPLIGRFISADTIVPSAGDPQSLNRYAYVQNNPLKYVDPSGHIPTVLVGAAVGALLTTGTYLVTAEIPTNGDWTEFTTNLAVVAAAGAAGGALIGTGVGAGAGMAVIASVTGVGGTTAAATVAAAAGVGAVASAEAYMVTTALKQETFDRQNFLIETTVGAAEGASSSLTWGLDSVAISGVAAAGGSLWKDVAHGRPMDYRQAAIEGAWGLGSGALAESLTGGFRAPSRVARDGVVDLTMTAFPNALARQTRQLEAKMLQEAWRTIGRDTLYSIGSNFGEDLLIQ